jgi:hypothetical protein
MRAFYGASSAEAVSASAVLEYLELRLNRNSSFGASQPKI